MVTAEYESSKDMENVDLELTWTKFDDVLKCVKK